MAQNAKNVRIDAAANVGAIAIAPAGTALPTDPTSELSTPPFAYVGIIGSDGVTVTPSINSTDIEDMNGNVVATVETGSKTEVAFPMLETNEVNLGLYHGSDNVTRTAGGGSGPDLITVQGGPIPTDHLVVVRDTVSGVFRRRTVWPDAKITGRDAEQVSGTAATVRAVTLTAFPYDGDGHTYLDYTQVAAASNDSSSSSGA